MNAIAPGRIRSVAVWNSHGSRLIAADVVSDNVISMDTWKRIPCREYDAESCIAGNEIAIRNRCPADNIIVGDIG